MAALSKTEARLLEKLDASPYGHAGYGGPREANAARKLEARGLVERKPCDGWYWHRHRNGDSSRRFWPQGTIKRTTGEPE